MITAHFGNIRDVLIEKLKSARYDVYIAVAWITDENYEKIILNLLENGVSVNIILVDDEINEDSGIDWQNLVENDANVFWDNHHHKFCVIDRKIVVTGSFNWTYNASNRNNRESILVIEDDQDLIEAYSREFQVLKNEAKKLVKRPKIIIQEKVVEKEIEREIEVIKEVDKRPLPYKKSGKFYCGICHNRMRPVKSPQHMVGFAFHCCKKCNIYLNGDGQII
jgi:phosphatidylserine/phosphatidylglycerophosphate/cardiolipin synthase-like enzyme